MRAILTALAIGAFAISATQAAAPAQAATSSGATVVNNTQCYHVSTKPGYTQCLTVKAESKETITRSGNTSYQVNGHQTSTIMDPAGQVVGQSTYEIHYQLLARDGVIHESGEHLSYTIPLAGKTCTFESDFHYANGSVRHSNFQIGCSWSLTTSPASRGRR